MTLLTDKNLRHLVAVMFLTVLVACNAPALDRQSAEMTTPVTQTDRDSPTVTVTPQLNWVIFSSDQAQETGLASWGVEIDGFWTPSADDILKLESKIAEYLSQNAYAFYRQPPVWERLDEYKRQYIGLERGGRRFIYGNYFCTAGGRNWRQDFVFVLDGGDCYFQTEYDVENGTFVMLLVNGEA